MIINIQGIDCHYRDLVESKVTEDGELIEGEEVLYANLLQDEQYFRRIKHPFTEEELEELAEIPYDERKNKYSPANKTWVSEQEAYMTYEVGGRYAMINGVLTFIPASYWGYLNFWELEHGEYPEYREADRIFFLFMEYLIFETDVLGCTRGKGRRQGASSLGFYFMWWICGRNSEKIGGSISYNDTMAQNNFQKMFMRGFKSMLICFVRDFDSQSDNFVRFIKTTEKKKKGVNKKREGLNSYCDYLPNSINAYDSGRVSFGLFDETGKYHKIDVNTYWSKVTPTLKLGRKKVGFAYMPTTVNPKEQGGENYKKFWNDADQNAINPNTGEPYGLNTPHKVVRYFVPATEGYAGCIDKFGQSVIDDPKEPIMGNDGNWITEGAKTVILKERALKKDDQKMEHRRDYPLDNYDMFAFETGKCEFNEDNIINQITYLENNPDKAFWRRIRLIEDIDEAGKIKVRFTDDPKGDIWLFEKPNEENKYKKVGTQLYPDNKLFYQAGADTYRNIFAMEGSEGVIVIFKKSCIINGQETGLYPVCIFDGRPKLIKQFNRQAFLLCLWYGCSINFEIDAGSWYYEDFGEWNAIGFLEWEPARDPTRKVKMIKPGTETAQPFQLAKQLEVAKLFFDGDGVDCYNGNTQRVTHIPMLKQALEYNHSERTPYHLIVALMMSLLPCLASPPPPKAVRRQPVLPTYKLIMRN